METNSNNQRFQKGVSGNPKGRPPRPKLPKNPKSALFMAVPKAVECLVSILNNPRSPLDLRYKCAESVLTRLYGKSELIIDKSETYDPESESFDIVINDDLSFITLDESGDTE